MVGYSRVHADYGRVHADYGRVHADYRATVVYCRLQQRCTVHIPSLQALQALQALHKSTLATVVCWSLLQSAAGGPRFADVAYLPVLKRWSLYANIPYFSQHGKLGCFSSQPHSFPTVPILSDFLLFRFKFHFIFKLWITPSPRVSESSVHVSQISQKPVL